METNQSKSYLLYGPAHTTRQYSSTFIIPGPDLENLFSPVGVQDTQPQIMAH